ncbi:MAG: hypothetical protein CMJ28_08065 [Phycisphaerae bacterium]|nr:hypothetical protein [Phycisphaerae bacterium]
MFWVHAKRVVVDTTCPDVDVFETSGDQLVPDGGRGDQGGTGGAMKFLQQPVSHAKRKFGVRLSIFGKFGVVGRGEWHTPAQAPAAGGDSDGPFGCNVYRVWSESIEPLGNRSKWPRCQAYFWVAGQWDGAAVVGGTQDFRLIAATLQNT